MLDLAHFLHFLSFALGLIAMFVVHGIWKETRNNHLWSYIVVLFCINLVSATHSWESFIKIKSSLGMGTIDLDLHLGILTVLLSVVRITLAYHFLQFTWKMTNSTWRPVYRSCYFVLLWLLPGTQALAVVFPNHILPSYQIAGIIACHLLVFVALLAGAIQVLMFSKSLEQKHLVRWLQVFCCFWLTFNLLIFANRVAGYGYLVSLNTQLLNFGIITLLLNSLHIVFSARFFNEYQRLNVKTDLQKIQRLYRKYGVSNREKEIIQLVCEGKTNKEIAKSLFISPNTVRDHTSNIYRKTNVKNRTQLASLFNFSHQE